MGRGRAVVDRAARTSPHAPPPPPPTRGLCVRQVWHGNVDQAGTGEDSGARGCCLSVLLVSAIGASLDDGRSTGGWWFPICPGGSCAPLAINNACSVCSSNLIWEPLAPFCLCSIILPLILRFASRHFPRLFTTENAHTPANLTAIPHRSPSPPAQKAAQPLTATHGYAKKKKAARRTGR